MAAKSKSELIPIHVQNVWYGLLPLKKSMWLRLVQIPEKYINEHNKFKLPRKTKGSYANFHLKCFLDTL